MQAKAKSAPKSTQIVVRGINWMPVLPVVLRDCAAPFVRIPAELTNQMWSAASPGCRKRSSLKSEYSSTEFQGFVGLSASESICMISQSRCRIAIADRLASGSNRQERHCEADTDCGRP
jgi:hypothetical protein